MLKKYPFIKQNDMKDCGITSLLMIIKYYGGNISLENLREMTKTTTKGVTAFHLIEAAKKLGFSAKGISCTLDKIDTENIILPCIAHVTIDKTYFHYVVIYEINKSKKELLVADPAKKIIKINFSEFKKIFNNILLIMHPIKRIPIVENEKSFYNYLKELIIKYKKSILFVFILSLIITIFSVITSFSFQFILKSLNQKNLFYKLFLIFLIIEILKSLNIFFRNQILIYLNKNISNKMFMDIFKKIILLPYNYYRNRTSGEIITRLNDLNTIRDILNQIILTLFVDFTLSIGVSIFLFSINRILFIIACLLLSMYFLLLLLIKPFFDKYIEKTKSEYANVNSYAVESLTGFETIKGLGIQNNIIEKMKYKFKKYIDNFINLNFISNIEQTMISIIDGIGNLVIIFIGIDLVSKKIISLGELITFIFLMSYFLEPIKNVLNLFKLFNEAKISFQRINEIVNYKLSSIKNSNLKLKNIELRNLNFTYDDRKLFIKDFNLKIKEKEKIVLIGESGNGKSTILKLLKKYYKNDGIYFNNKNINTISQNDIDENISYISQNEILFTDTIYNNIVLGEKINQKTFFEVVKACLIEEIIADDNLGYYKLIEENGFNLSGGERQRIILARTLLKNRKFIFIDEGLNQLDISMERKILKNIFKLYPNKTFLFVTHRKDNIDLFERMIKIENGRIIQDLKRNN